MKLEVLKKNIKGYEVEAEELDAESIYEYEGFQMKIQKHIDENAKCFKPVDGKKNSPKKLVNHEKSVKESASIAKLLVDALSLVNIKIDGKKADRKTVALFIKRINYATALGLYYDIQSLGDIGEGQEGK